MLSILIPAILVVFFVLGEASSGSVADYIPDRAGQQILYADPLAGLAPWTGLAVTAL